MNSRRSVRRLARWVAAPACAALPLVCSAEDTYAQATLDTVVTTATRTPQAVQNVVADISVVTAEELARSGQTSLREVLQRLPGVQMNTNGSYSSNTSLFIRGAETNRIVVLVDGVRIGSATSGGTPFENLAVSQIERIEVLRGPATTLYGPDAVGGVIQIFTRRGGGQTHVHAEAGLGSHGLAKLGAGLRGGAGAVGYSLAVGLERAGGISTRTDAGGSSYNPDDDGFRNATLSGSLNWTLAPGHVLSGTVLVARSRHEFDSTPFPNPLSLTGPTTDAQARNGATVLGVTLESALTDWWQSSLRLGLSEDRANSVFHRESDHAFVGNARFDTERRQLAWQHTLKFGPDRLIASIERLQDKVDSTVLYTTGKRTTDSLMLAYAFDRGPWLGQLAARYDDNSQFGSFTTGSIALGYRLSQHLRLTGSLANNFQAPTFNQLYYPGFGNPLLEPQRNKGKEVALKYDNGRLNGSVTLYRNRIRGFINPGNATQSSMALLEGATVEAGWRRDGWTVSGSFDLLNPEEQPSGRRLIRRADKTAQMLVERSADWGSAFAELLAVSAREDGSTVRTRMGGYGVLNIGAQYRVAPGWTLLGRVNNLTDKDYTTAVGYSQLGRTVFVGLQYGGTLR